ncbi:MAG TPA: hypothetical protein VJI98_03280 [Candidatus Nanoarchaeia archaeon]|nr:hypothetical protein [Candidatus Nanoarchaeia archaeon]
MPTDINAEIESLRSQGLTDNLIQDELTRQGHPTENVEAALSQNDIPVPMPGGGMDDSYFSGMSEVGPSASRGAMPNEGSIYDRIEEMTENLIDEKWEELISEVKKIVEWKEKIEERQSRMMSDLDRLKKDFDVLHQGVLGKLDDYDSRMTDVGTELKAVGRVFKEVIPEFVENVKELKSITGKKKARTEGYEE